MLDWELEVKSAKMRVWQFLEAVLQISPVWNLAGGLQLFIFPYIGYNHPNWLFFFRGVKPPTSEPLIHH